MQASYHVGNAVQNAVQADDGVRNDGVGAAYSRYMDDSSTFKWVCCLQERLREKTFGTNSVTFLPPHNRAHGVMLHSLSLLTNA